MNHISENFYRNPRGASQTMTRKELKETLLATDGWVFSCGYAWDVKSKHLGAGVYKVTLTEQKS